MNSKLKIVALAAAGWLASTQLAFANFGGNIPEPGTLALVGLGLAAAIAIGKRRK